jgi:hypothetical protein
MVEFFATLAGLALIAITAAVLAGPLAKMEEEYTKRLGNDSNPEPR